MHGARPGQARARLALALGLALLLGLPGAHAVAGQTSATAGPASAPAASNPAATPPATPAATPGAASTPAVTEPPAAPCEAEDTDTVDGDPNSGMASESFAAQRVRIKPTAATRIACALRKGRRKAALEIADTFLATHPKDAQVRFLRAVILGDLNRPDEAATALELLTEDYPELAEPYNNLAVIRANQGDLGTAEHYLQMAIAAQPNYATARENLGDLYISLAAAAYEQALKMTPANANVRRKLGLARELGGKLRDTR